MYSLKDDRLHKKVMTDLSDRNIKGKLIGRKRKGMIPRMKESEDLFNSLGFRDKEMPLRLNLS